MSNITYVSWEEGDWYAIYQDGKLIDDGHSIRGIDILNLLSIPYTHLEVPTSSATNRYLGEECCGIKELADLEAKIDEP